MVTACPICDSPEVHERTTAPEESRWKCRACRSLFPKPVERERRDMGRPNEQREALVEADPEDLPLA